MRGRVDRPAASATTKNTSGTITSAPLMRPMMTKKRMANGKSTSTLVVTCVKKLRTLS